MFFSVSVNLETLNKNKKLSMLTRFSSVGLSQNQGSFFDANHFNENKVTIMCSPMVLRKYSALDPGNMKVQDILRKQQSFNLENDESHSDNDNEDQSDNPILCDDILGTNRKSWRRKISLNSNSGKLRGNSMISHPKQKITFKKDQDLYKFFEDSQLYTILFEIVCDYILLDLKNTKPIRRSFHQSEIKKNAEAIEDQNIAQPQLLNIVVPVYENFIEMQKPKFLRYFQRLSNNSYNSQLFIENDLFLCLIMKEFISESEKIKKQSEIYTVRIFCLKKKTSKSFLLKLLKDGLDQDLEIIVIFCSIIICLFSLNKDNNWDFKISDKDAWAKDAAPEFGEVMTLLPDCKVHLDMIYYSYYQSM